MEPQRTGQLSARACGALCGGEPDAQNTIPAVMRSKLRAMATVRRAPAQAHTTHTRHTHTDTNANKARSAASAGCSQAHAVTLASCAAARRRNAAQRPSCDAGRRFQLRRTRVINTARQSQKGYRAREARLKKLQPDAGTGVRGRAEPSHQQQRLSDKLTHAAL